MQRKTLGLRRNLKEEKRRAAIINAAINVFSQKGYVQATMDDIVVEAGCSKTLIYWYWKNKASLMSGLIDNCMLGYIELMECHLQSDQPFEAKAGAFIVEFLELFKKNEKLNKIVHFGSLHFSKGDDEDLGKKVNEYYHQVLNLLEAFIFQGIEEGYLKKELNAQAIAFQILSGVEGYIYMSILEKRMPIETALLNLYETYDVLEILKKK